jgi:hypothetical protein
VLVSFSSSSFNRPIVLTCSLSLACSLSQVESRSDFQAKLHLVHRDNIEEQKEDNSLLTGLFEVGQGQLMKFEHVTKYLTHDIRSLYSVD